MASKDQLSHDAPHTDTQAISEIGSPRHERCPTCEGTALPLPLAGGTKEGKAKSVLSLSPPVTSPLINFSCPTGCLHVARARQCSVPARGDETGQPPKHSSHALACSGLRWQYTHRASCSVAQGSDPTATLGDCSVSRWGGADIRRFMLLPRR